MWSGHVEWACGVGTLARLPAALQILGFSFSFVYLRVLCGESPPSPMRRIGRSRRIHINVQSQCRTGTRRIAVPIATVVGAVPGHILALRRLRELPYFCESDPAPSRTRRLLRKRTSGRWRTRVIDRPIRDLTWGAGALARVFPNILGSDDITVVLRRNPRTIDPRAKSHRDNSTDPGMNVSLLLRQHAPALFLVEKDDGFFGKPFAPCG